MTSSIYSPLRGDRREFRLLVLKPSPYLLAPLRYELNQVSFDDNGLEYTALSYTWGNALKTAPISVNGGEIQITWNLEAALRYIRKSSDAITLWVDAMCINQSDVAEKNHQVEMMREIFSGAKLVIAWLGVASEDSDLAMELLGTGLDALLERRQDREALPLTEQEALAIARLMTRSWWSRIWVVQEVLLSKKVIFRCGDAEVPGAQIKSNEVLRMDAILFLVDRDYIPRYNNALSLLEDMVAPNENANAVDYIVRYRTRQATKPHDHVYGLFGIFPKADQILLGAPNYNCRVEDLFISTATKLMLQQNSLALLKAAASTPSAGNSLTKNHLPSWVPDWTRPELIGSGINLKWANPFSEVEFQFSPDSNELMLAGFEVQKIESVKLVPTLGQGKLPIWQDVRERRNDQRSPPLRGIIVALFIAYSPFGLECLEHTAGFDFVANLLQELKTCRIRDEAGEAHNKADYLSGLLEWTGDSRDGRTDQEILENIFSARAAQAFVEWYHTRSKTALKYSYVHYALSRVTPSKCFMFRTREGLFGITTTGNIAPEDMLCIVPTCPAPLLFRKVQSSKHMLIGFCLPIAGMTGKKIAQAVEKGEIVKESFTLV